MRSGFFWNLRPVSRAKLKDLAPGTVFNAGPIDVRVLEHFADGRTLLIADTCIADRHFAEARDQSAVKMSFERIGPSAWSNVARNSVFSSRLRFEKRQSFGFAAGFSGLVLSKKSFAELPKARKTVTTMKKTTFKQCAAGDVFEHQGQALIKTTKPNTAVNLNSGAFAHFHDGSLVGHRLSGGQVFRRPFVTVSRKGHFADHVGDQK